MRILSFLWAFYGLFERPRVYDYTREQKFKEVKKMDIGSISGLGGSERFSNLLAIFQKLQSGISSSDSEGPQKVGDPQPHLYSNDSVSFSSEASESLAEQYGLPEGGPQKVGDPQPHLNGGSGGPQKAGDPQPHLGGGPQKPGDPR